MLRLLLATLVTALFAGAVAASANQAERQPERIVAVGDLHGDFAAWQDVATAASLIDADGDWNGGETILVQLGDVTDRGPDSRKIIDNLRDLQKQADKAGGEVVLLIGNHEAMNVTGDLRYVHPGEYAAFVDRKSRARLAATWDANEDRIIAFYREREPDQPVSTIRELWFAANPPGSLEHRAAWRPGGHYGDWAASLPAVAKIGDTLFVHGGLSAERGLQPLDAINAAIAAALAEGDDVDRAAADDPLGPLWYRGNVLRGDDDAMRMPLEEELSQVLAYHGSTRLVVGHTPAIKGIAAAHGGRVIRADTGISAHYGGPASYLEMTPDEVVAHERGPDGTWVARVLDGTTTGEAP